MIPIVKTLAQTLVSEYVTVDGIKYQINSKYAAIAYSLTEDFTGTSVVLADYVEGVWRNGNDEEKVNVPVVRFNTSLITDNITSLSLSRNYTGGPNSFGNTYRNNIDLYRSTAGYGRNLKEITVADGNPYYSSVNGLLCNATGDTLLYVPFNYAGNDKLIIPAGIRHILKESYAQVYINNKSQNFSVKHIVFEDSVTNVFIPSYNNFTRVKFTNNLPPQVSWGGTVLFYTPAGSASAYFERYKNNSVLAILEENSNIKNINRNAFSGTQTVYDLDGDGEMECVGYTNNYYQPYSDVVRNPQRNSFLFMKKDECIHRDSITDKMGQSENLSIKTFRIEQNPCNDKLQYVINDKIIQQTDENLCATIFNEDYSLYVDVDNDGLKDIVSKYNSSGELDIFMQQPDGSFIKSKPYLTEKVEEMETEDGTTLLSFLQGFLRNDMFVDDAPTCFQNINKAVDFNNDGISDFIDDVAGGIMYSYADGKYFTSKSKEIVYPVDIDNDGILDYVVFDGTTLYLMTNVTSATAEKKELFKNSKIDKVFFKDFDHDGDIDIFTFISSTTNNDDISYFVFLRNNSGGTFRKKESSLADTQYALVDCRDYDADGKYELLVIDKSYNGASQKNDGLLLKVENNFTISTVSETFGIPQSTSYKQGKNLILGDFDNDGFTEFYSNNGDLYGFLSSQTIQNTAPNKMEKPTALYDPATNRLKITWVQGQDQETSACDLTYALRIGTAPGLDDIVRPASLADGRRKTIRDGEIGTALSTLYNAAGLKPGKYYISVQAIDGGGLGGQFSEELEYEHKLSAPQICVSAHELSTADTLEVYMKHTIADATYEWTTNEGNIIEKTGNKAKVVFRQSGIHELNLTMSIGGVDYKAIPQEINVLATKYYGQYQYGYPFMDINQNGLIDTYSGYNVYKNDNGSFSPIQLSTFADLNGAIDFVTDFNHDGYPDFIISNCSKGNVFLNYGEQDYDFDYQTKEINIPRYVGRGIDLNNDGWPDFDSYGFCYSEPFLKDYNWTSYSDFTNLGTYDYAIDLQFIDVNRDGFMDIVWGVENQDETIVYCKLKDNTTDCAYGEPIVLFRLPYELRRYYTKIDNPDPEKYEYVYAGNSYNGVVFEDFNNDGYLDLGLAIQKFVNKHPWSGATEENNEFAFYILKGKPEGESSEIAQKIDNVFKISDNVYDINNDGYKDIPYFEMNASRKWNGWNDDYAGDVYTLLLRPDFDYKIVQYKSPEGKEVIPMSTNGIISLGGINYKTNIPNQSPAAPASVTAKQTRDGMLITWSDAVDKETPAMQMRYNISVKRKGKTGENAFVISPMNGLKDEAAIVPGYDYKKSTQMLIPSSVLTAGETYEIQVQAIDLWGAHSPMTNAVELTMGDNGYIDIAERTATNKETLVKFIGTQAASYSLEVGEDGEILQDKGNGEYVVMWSTEGVKELILTVGSTQIKSQIAVVKPLDMTFMVPEMVLAGTPIAIKVSSDMAAAPANVGWRCDNSKVDVNYSTGSAVAYISFPEPGVYTLEAFCTDSVRGNSYKQTITVTDIMPEAIIQRADVYEGYYYVMWDETSLPSYIDKVIVLKEGSSLNQFMVVDTVSASKGYYIDLSSNTSVVSNRYRIMLMATNGQTSNMSDIHKPLHVMIGYSAMGGYNLMWNGYEGLTVDNYQIWRGDNPDNMEIYAQVAGSQLSYTDLWPLDGISYYSIVFNPQQEVQESRRAVLSGSDDMIRSNYVSTQNATALVLAQSIEITNGTDVTLTTEKPDVHLRCTILPAYCSIDKVAWSITEGSDLATIDDKGHLHATGGKGNVKVCAKTLDGSDLTAEISIPCDVRQFILGDVNDDGIVDVSDAVVTINVIHKVTTNPDLDVACDINFDGEVDVFDVTKLIGIILSNNNMAMSRAAIIEEPYLESIHMTSEGNSVWLGVDNAERFTAFQFNVVVPEGIEMTDVDLAGATNHQVVFAKAGENMYTVIGLSMNNESLPMINDRLIKLSLSDNSIGEVRVENVKFVTPNEETVYFNGDSSSVVTGISNVNAAQGNKNAYDLYGRKVKYDRSQLKHGVYIINGKKEVIK